MPKASEVAAELRKLADGLDVDPEAEIQRAWVRFNCYEREPFLATARLLPRPLAKGEDFTKTDYQLTYGNTSSSPMYLVCSVPKNKACKLIKPAKPAVYDCLPILEQNELDAVSS